MLEATLKFQTGQLKTQHSLRSMPLNSSPRIKSQHKSFLQEILVCYLDHCYLNHCYLDRQLYIWYSVNFVWLSYVCFESDYIFFLIFLILAYIVNQMYVKQYYQTL